MKKHLMVRYDSLGGFVLGLDLSPLDGEQYVSHCNRVNLMQPDPFAENTVLFEIGEYDDEKLEGSLLPAPRKLGTLDYSVGILKAHADKMRKEKEAADKLLDEQEDNLNA